MAQGVGRASAGHAVQLAAEALKGIAIVINRIGARKKFACFCEQDDYAAHDKTSSGNVHITRGDGNALGPEMVNHLAGTVDDVLHSQPDALAKVG